MKKILGQLLALFAVLSCPLAAHAIPITYTFEYGDTSGPLGPFSGISTFTYDDSVLGGATIINYQPDSIYPQVLVSNSNEHPMHDSFVLDVDLELGGVHFDESNIGFSSFRFDLDGQLIGLLFGPLCSVDGSCSSYRPDLDLAFYVAVGPAIPVIGNTERIVYQFGGVADLGHAKNLVRVPEPGTLALFGISLVGLVLARRSHIAQQ